MRTIHKYQLENISKQVITIPKGYRILSLQAQKGTPCIWAEVETNNEAMTLDIRTYGTGHELPFGHLNFIGTYQQFNGDLVLHVFSLQ